MSILLVFTHPDSIQDTWPKIANREDVVNLRHLPILQFDEVLGKFTPCSDGIVSGLYFVSDNHADAENLLAKHLPVSRSDVFILKHQHPNYDIDAAQVEIGHHIAGDRFYQPVFDFLLDGEQEKFSRILDAVFPQILPITLQLLHSCLVPKNAPRKLPEKLIAEYRNKYEQFWAAAGGGLDDVRLTQADPFDPTYIVALSNLRDALLA